MDSDEDTQDILYDEGGSNNESSESEVDCIDLETNMLETKKDESEEYSYQVLSTDETIQHMMESIKEVNSVLEMPEPITRILLNYFKWDKQKLLDRFYDGNQDELFKEAHVVNPFKAGFNASSLKASSRPSSLNRLQDCKVCYLSLPASDFTGLQCGHRFCMDCWDNYLKIKIMDEGIVQTIACIEHKCEILVDDTTVMKLVVDLTVKRKYQHLIINSFVDCNKLMRWCPNKGCNKVIKVQCADAKPVKCECHMTFCFECADKWHEPLSCELLHKWKMKCKDDSETSKWIVAYTKPCPKCHTSIEKNGGCNHMTCKKCGHSFCWLCHQPWNVHDYDRGCNVFVEKKFDAESYQRQNRELLEKYLFYSTRYMSHLRSLKFEKELYNNVKYKMEDMEEHNMTWAEAQFLKKSVDTLLICRQTLMFTYAYAFYLEKNNQTAIFEANQQDLEHSVEVLSGYLERDIAIENLADIKQKVLNKYVYCEGRRQTLLKHIREAHENDWWKIDVDRY